MDKYEYYNEDNYLNDDSVGYDKIIYQKKMAYISDIKKDAMKYGSNIQAYDEYISFIAYLIKCLSIPRDTLNASIVLNLITKKGIFSDGHKIITRGVINNDLAGFLGINVIRGHAVCRHLSSFQMDVLKKLNLMSESFYTYLSDKDISTANNKKGNHAINLIEYKDNLYGYDALNNGLFRFVSDRKLEELFTSQKHYLYYKPYLHMMLDDMNIGNVISMLSLFDTIKSKKTITYEEFNKIYENANNVVNKNTHLLDDFHESSKKYIKRITENL